ncbi:hypothetical protein Cni_G15290 [Canna indica]|uniref:J domain-containing protein n=1 Tax=Canna indica TaxID=4628 RepID=A0AAQ3QEM1_9LILI|nr:hypothetical protein Cni_G15290 [Canna indica]
MNSDGRGREVAARWVEIAERLLRERDLVGSKRFAERAVEEDPFVDGADQIIAAAEVLLASQRRINNQADWYAVLQLDSATPAGRDPSAVRRQYRRLALLLNPGRNQLDSADFAAKLVADAWAVLSDPSKKALFDAEVDLAAAAAAAAAKPPFWTACPACYHLHQFESHLEGKNLRCPTCGRAFRASALQTEPPIVPGTDMYYCSWGFLPLGFGGQSKPFYPIFPVGQQQQQQPQFSKGTTDPKVTPLTSVKKAVAKKKVGSRLGKKVLVAEAKSSSEATKSRPTMTNMNAEDGHFNW